MTNKLQIIDSSAPKGDDLDFLYETTTTKKFTMGQRVALNNGMVFHYARAGEALTPNKICEAATMTSGNNHPYILGSGSTAGYGGAVGARQVRIKTSANAITANQFQGGQYVISSYTAAGGMSSLQNLLIKSHPAAASDSECILQLHTPLQYTVDSRTQGGLIPNIFSNVMLKTAAGAYPVGICIAAVASGSYFWLQTWGPTSVQLSASFPVIGGMVTAGSTAGGVVTSGTNVAYYPLVGFCGPWTGAAANINVPMFLTLVP